MSEGKGFFLFNLASCRRVFYHPAMISNPATSSVPASKDAPFVNGLGMPFVPVPRFSTLFCVWPVRASDFETYASDKGVEMPTQAAGSTSDHPVVNVTWHEAGAFCEWLTQRERAAGSIGSDVVYRLPGDLEWSAAVGLPEEPESNPEKRSGQADGFPWGSAWPPAQNAGNYSQELGVDSFEFTSPVGSFPANAFGIYDLGGNVWEWCQDRYERTSDCRVLRGASWFNGYADRLKSSFRNDVGLPDSRFTSFGLRVVLGPAL
jgi:formylglycine-generating enzyme required for sulfatase activity